MDISINELYQQTIEIVLSEDRYAAYQKWQADREAFRQQTFQNILVVWLEMILKLEGQQVADMTATARKLTLPERNSSNVLAGTDSSVVGVAGINSTTANLNGGRAILARFVEQADTTSFTAEQRETLNGYAEHVLAARARGENAKEDRRGVR